MNLSTEADSVEMSEEEKKIIDARLDAYHKNPDVGSLWKDVFNRLANKQ